jgi:hypothetical protein
MKNKIIVILGCVFLLLFSHCMSSRVNSTGGKYKLDGFHSADFPAFVESIHFGSGNILSATSPLKWGNWTISFSSTHAPIAKNGGGGDIYMTGFVAKNPAQGEYSCTIQACKACAYTSEQGDRKQFIRRCRIMIGDDPKVFYNVIEIDCFTDVKLK